MNPNCTIRFKSVIFLAILELVLFSVKYPFAYLDVFWVIFLFKSIIIKSHFTAKGSRLFLRLYKYTSLSIIVSINTNYPTSHYDIHPNTMTPPSLSFTVLLTTQNTNIFWNFSKQKTCRQS